MERVVEVVREVVELGERVVVGFEEGLYINICPKGRAVEAWGTTEWPLWGSDCLVAVDG